MEQSYSPVARGATATAEGVAFFIALVATALALGAALAHALELPSKLLLDRQSYYVAQRLYDGWDRLGFLIAIELISLLAVVAMHRHDPHVATPAALALAAVFAAQVVFWIFTFPTNRETANWTTQLENWEQLRSQ